MGHRDELNGSAPGVNRSVTSSSEALLHVFYINFEFPPISGPAVWRALGFVKYLARNGHRVRVFCTDRPTWHTRRDPSLLYQIPSTSVMVDRLSAPLLQDMLDALEARAERTQSALVARGLRGIAWRLARYYPEPCLAWALRAAGYAAWRSVQERPDCVITSGPIHLSHIVGLLLARMRRVPWIADFRDLWMDDEVQRCHGPYQEWLFRRVELAVLRWADAIVTVSPSWCRYFEERLAPWRQEHKVRLIRNGHDLDEVRLRELPPRTRCPRLHIHFSGTVQVGNQAPCLLEALEIVRLEARTPSLLVTFTGIEPAFRFEIERRGLGEVIQDVGALSWCRSIEYSWGADVLLVTVNNGNPLYRGTIPGKLYEAMALGLPILAIVPRESDVRALLEGYAHATCADVSDSQDVARALRSLLERHAAGELGRERATATVNRAWSHSRGAQTRQLISLIEEIVRRK